jgi:hypothetical protein
VLLIYGFGTAWIENYEKEKKIFNFFHIISFPNSQSADYYVFSTITMMTLNTANCGTQKQQDEIIMVIRILHLLRPNSAPSYQII